MSELKEIKQRIYSENKIDKILEHIGCEYISWKSNRVEAKLPPKFETSNTRSVQVRLSDTLPCSIRNKADFNGDIFSLVSYIYNDKRGEDINKDLFNAKAIICEILGWKEYLTGKFVKPKVDYVASLRALSGRKTNTIVPNKVLDESVLDDYIKLSCKAWIDEGIPHDIQMLYDVRFDLESKRVTFPIRNRLGKIVGVKGRLIKKEDELKEPKYIYLHKCNISQEWFNLHFAFQYILSERFVIIVESEKSCMKLASFGIWNSIAIGSSDISELQANIVDRLGKDIKVILAYDKDKTEEEVREKAKIFKNEVYAVIDNDDLLEQKDAPVDKGFEVWKKLFNNSIKISK